MATSLKQNVANFFYFSLLDENLASEASIRGYAGVTAGFTGKEDEITPPQIILGCSKTWRKYNRKKFSKASHLLESGWLTPEGVDLGLWMHFRREAKSDEYLAVVWSLIVGFSDEDIAKGLGISVGTVRHRVARGLKRLGELQGGD